MTYKTCVKPVLSLDEVRTLNDMVHLVNHMNDVIKKAEREECEFSTDFKQAVHTIAEGLKEFNMMDCSFDTPEAENAYNFGPIVWE